MAHEPVRPRRANASLAALQKLAACGDGYTLDPE
jgi:hypothetical protein